MTTTGFIIPTKSSFHVIKDVQCFIGTSMNYPGYVLQEIFTNMKTKCVIFLI